VTNCILWGDTPNEIFNYVDATSTISFSDVQGGLPPGTIDGGGNIDADPLFVDPDGVDDVPGTEDDDLRLSAGSPGVDAGDNTAVPIGITTDLDGNARFVDDLDSPDCPQPGADCGTPPIVDMGAYEFQEEGEGIPAVSEWGTLVMSVLLLAAGTLVFWRRQAPRPERWS
jgi:hypothetical protein